MSAMDFGNVGSLQTRVNISGLEESWQIGKGEAGKGLESRDVRCKREKKVNGEIQREGLQRCPLQQQSGVYLMSKPLFQVLLVPSQPLDAQIY